MFYKVVHIFILLNQKLSIFSLFNQFLSFTKSGLWIFMILCVCIFVGSGSTFSHLYIKIFVSFVSPDQEVWPNHRLVPRWWTGSLQCEAMRNGNDQKRDMQNLPWHWLEDHSQINTTKVNFLDAMLDLRSEEFHPYIKEGNIPLYVLKESNHPPSILENIPKSINKRLSEISLD